MRIAIVTAGAAGMYCGSCLRDNALARALCRLGHDVQLIPLYTPIRTDLPDASSRPIFLGGINAYLRQRYRALRPIPYALTRWLDHPRLINWLAGQAVQTDAAELGALTLTVLKAEQGVLRKEFERLVQWLIESRPEVVHFSNIMIAGAARLVRQKTAARVVVSLQGDDIFLDGLPDRDREQVVAEVAQFEPYIDAYVAHSQFYARKMSEYLNVPYQKIQIQRLATELDDLREITRSTDRMPKRIGYLARLAPEKGLHLLCEAFIKLRDERQLRDVELHIAGHEAKQHAAYVEKCVSQLQSAAPSSFKVWQTVDRSQKFDFLQHVDVISVPSPYEEPKGLYVLESLAAGVPVVQPAHGAFPELLKQTEGGLLFEPNSVASLTDSLLQLLQDGDLMRSLGDNGREAVFAQHTSDHEASAMLELYEALPR